MDVKPNFPEKNLTDSKLETGSINNIKLKASFVDQMNNAVIAIDLENNITHWNQHATKLYQWTEKEAIGRDIIELLAPEALTPTILSNIEEINTKGKRESEFNVKRKDGTYIPAFIINTILKNTDDEPIGILGVSSDITALKDHERFAHENEERLLVATETARLGTYDWLVLENITHWNKRMYELFNLETDNKVDKNVYFQSVLDPDDKSKIQSKFIDLLGPSRSENSYRYDYKIILKNGDIKNIVTFGSIRRNTEGLAIRVIGSCIDVTKEKQYQQTIIENEEKFKSIVQDQTEMIVRWKPNGIRTFVNNSYCQENEISKNEAIGSSLMQSFPPEELLIFKKRIGYINKEHPINTGKHQVRIKSDTLVWQEWTDRGFFDAQGKIIEYQSVGRNISRQVQAEQQLKEAFTEVSHLKSQLEQENTYLREEIKLNYNFENMIFGNSIFKRVLTLVEQVSQTDATVLILGETGTGKELIARAVHNLSKRKNRSLVKINCATLPKDLIESELFGHEKGSFTGATQRKIGKFELADGGTIFLDEIGELPISLQTKLLRVLQEGEFERVGGNTVIKVAVRVVAATNRDLETMIKLNKFRSDLFYRLNVFPIKTPPLRERIEDIPLLLYHFVDQYSKKLSKPIKSISKSTMSQLQNYLWPGNIREMENLIERAVILSNNGTLKFDQFSEDKDANIVNIRKGNTLSEIEHAHILQTLRDLHWVISGQHGAAQQLDLKPSTLRDKMKKLGIIRPKKIKSRNTV